MLSFGDYEQQCCQSKECQRRQSRPGRDAEMERQNYGRESAQYCGGVGEERVQIGDQSAVGEDPQGGQSQQYSRGAGERAQQNQDGEVESQK